MQQQPRFWDRVTGSGRKHDPHPVGYSESSATVVPSLIIGHGARHHWPVGPDLKRGNDPADGAGPSVGFHGAPSDSPRCRGGLASLRESQLPKMNCSSAACGVCAFLPVIAWVASSFLPQSKTKNIGLMGGSRLLLCVCVHVCVSERCVCDV